MVMTGSGNAFLYRLSYVDKNGPLAAKKDLWGEYAHGDDGRPAGQVMRHHLDRQPGAVGGEARRRHVVQPDAVLEVAYGVLDLGVAAMIGLQSGKLYLAKRASWEPGVHERGIGDG